MSHEHNFVNEKGEYHTIPGPMGLKTIKWCWGCAKWIEEEKQ